MGPNNQTVDEEAPAPNQSQPYLHLKTHDWKSWAYTDGGCSTLDGKCVIGGGAYQPTTNNINLDEHNVEGLINTIGRAKLASIAAALTYGYSHFAKTSLPLFTKSEYCILKSTVILFKVTS